MDRYWQWAWDRYGARYSWAIWIITFATGLPVYLAWSWMIVAFAKSRHYLEASLIAGVVVLVLAFTLTLPGNRLLRRAERWKVAGSIPALATTSRFCGQILTR